MEKAEIEVSDQMMFCILVGRNRHADFDPFVTFELKNLYSINGNFQKILLSQVLRKLMELVCDILIALF